MDELRAGDPKRIGVYRLLGRLGAGGMGVVYLARSDRGRTVAVKLVRGELAEQDEFRSRFRQEVQAARRVGGAWTAPVLDADTEADTPWVATGYIAGPSLEKAISEHGPLPERSVKVLADGLARALGDIHAAGLIHRDLKPSNVLVTIDGPRVIDFGIARALETVAGGGLTRTGALVGSPGFMAPEQVRGGRITPACDVFCLGSVLAYAASGRLPFGSATSGVHALLFRIAEETPDLSGLPEELAELVGHCLAKEPAARPSPEQVLERVNGGRREVAGRAGGEPWLPGSLVAQLGRHAVQLLDAENPDGSETAALPRVASPATSPQPSPDSPSAGRPAGPGTAGYGPPTPGVSGLAAGLRASGPGASGARVSGAGVSASGAEGSAPSGPSAAAAPGPHAPQAPGYAESTGPGPQRSQGPVVPRPQGPGYQAPATPAPHGSAPQPGGYGPPPAAAYGYPQRPAPSAAPVGAGGHHHPAAVHPAQPFGPGPSPTAIATDRRRRTTAILVAVAAVVVVTGWTTVSTFMNDGSDGSRNHVRGDDPTGGDGGASADGGGSGGNTSGGGSSDAIPSRYLGTWEAHVGDSSVDVRRFTLRQGDPGDAVFTMIGEGAGYHCEFSAKLTTVGPPLELGPSTVTSAEPATSCKPGPSTTLEPDDDGTLRRVFSDGSAVPLTYTKTS